MLVQMERQIDREIAADNKANCMEMSAQTDDMHQSIGLSVEDNMYDSDSEDDDETVQPMLVYGPQPQVVTNDLRSLDEMVSTFDFLSLEGKLISSLFLNRSGSLWQSALVHHSSPWFAYPVESIVLATRKY